MTPLFDASQLATSPPWIIALTGASGTVYGRRLLATLAEKFPEQQLEVVISDAALRVLREEEGLTLSHGKELLSELIGSTSARITLNNNKNIGARIASGSFRTSGMVIVPCSMKTLAAVASGYSDSLVHRAADVTLKERRRLIIVPREAPLSEIHLENMLKLSRMGTIVMPAMPGFYSRPRNLTELVDTVVERLLDLMGLPLPAAKRWGEE